jgi:hypothetical protein
LMLKRKFRNVEMPSGPIVHLELLIASTLLGARFVSPNLASSGQRV